MQFILLRRCGFPFSRPFHSHHLIDIVAITTRERNTVTATPSMKIWSFTSMTTRMNCIIMSQPWATPQLRHPGPLQVTVVVINILNFDLHSSPSSNNYH